MTADMTNRHGDEIRIGQIWLDDPRRTVIRSLRVDDFADAGSLGTAAVCTVVLRASLAPRRFQHRVHATCRAMGNRCLRADQCLCKSSYAVPAGGR
ncbi:hypothetical protein HYG77_37625 (plasmid) [Rhodococcus sp. ZPP]|uniref:hypothetical protein n=1 Tax=Rhodococcus TaxID=1827 RepID=UPI0006BB4E10|nr:MULTISPECIES: hypothetical protein [Rhodococcus]QHE73677.1 hypothetical protein GFS60_07340 [Rhodococcus sp. WAY2]QTJ71164.1 hypothetical protein HYG77_37625 [Rhodococcus sp. ZPP]